MINSYKFGQIDVDGKEYTSDIIILPAGLMDNWWRGSGHELSTEDIQPVLDSHPEIIVVGTGASGMMRVLPEVKETLLEAGIELIVKRTEEACKVFNEVSPKRKTVAALHLTC
jgi:hypothetical protein